jgi:signal transduction histidine kinase
MQTAETLTRSLTFQCLACVVAYAAIMIALFVSAYSFSERKLDNAFPSLETIQEQDAALQQDRFATLKSSLPNSCQLIVFDETGHTLYASSSYIAERISAQDLSIISANEDERTYYEVFSQEDDRGDPAYTVLLCSTDIENNVKTVLGSCLLDSELNIESGTLFRDRSSLTEREFSLIKGMFESRMYIEKLEYQTEDGDMRILVLASPFMTEAAYDAAIAEANRIWLFVTPAALALTAVMVLVVAHLIRHTMRPLDIAIENRQNGHAHGPESKNLPWELRPTYNRFAVLMEQLDAAQANEQRIIADISHDLKTPLTIIRGYAQAFEDGRVAGQKREQYLHAINVKSQEASKLIDSLFAFAEMRHPSYIPALERRDLNQVVRDIAAGTQAETEQAGCSLIMNIGKDPIFAEIDESLIRRAVSNLVANACKHNPAGTVIMISCRSDDAEATVSVSDDGVGIPAELRDTILEPFVTSNVARKPGAGTGLGLSIASRCAQLNNATLSLAPKAAPPFVTEFTIQIPLCAPNLGIQS